MMSKKLRRTHARERGVVIWTVMLLILAMSGLSVGMLWNGLGEKTSVEQRRTSLVALQICEMGTMRAQMEIVAQKDSGTDGIGFVSGTYAGGTYEVTSVQTPGYPDRWTVTAEGRYRNSLKRIETGVRRRRQTDFVEGIFAKDTVTANGDLSTDAFDSRLGTYATQAVNKDGAGVYASGGGHVGSNGQISLNGTAATIRGNAIPGAGETVSMSGTPDVWGDMMARRREIPIPDVPLEEFEAVMLTNDNDNIIDASGGKPAYNTRDYSLSAGGSRVVTLPGGTYFFSSVQFSGGAQLVVTGKSTVYVSGGFDVSGGALLNMTGDPGSLIVYAHPYDLPSGGPPNTSATVEFAGGSQTAVAVYAPAMDIRVHGNGDVYGAAVGQKVTLLGDTDFHYDKALGAWDKHTVIFIERLYWRDLSAPLR